MYAKLKTKGSRKNKEKTPKVSIEEGIPEVPRITDFHLTESVEHSGSTDDSVEIATCDLANEVEVLDLDEKESKDEDKNFVGSGGSTEREGQSSPCNRIEIGEKKESLGIVEYPQILDSEGSVGGSKILDHKSSETNIRSTELPNSPCASNDLENLPEISGYSNLATKVKTFIEEINEPSAPTADKNIPALNIPVQELQQSNNEKVLSIEKPVDISKYNFTLIVQDLLPPFSDEQLSEYYYNSELQESKTYIDEFLHQEINNGTKGNHKLYKLLVEYMQSKNCVKSSEAKIQDLREKLNSCVATMWTIYDDVKVTEKEKCSDGNFVEFVETYTQAQLNVEVFKAFTSLLNQIKYELYEVHTMNSFMCSLLKLKIEYYLQCLLTSCPEFTNFEAESSLVLLSSSPNSHFQECLLDLKIAISILFIFQRKQTLEVSSSFLEETRQWLSDLVSILLRVGNWKDHIFLLNHIVRCPGGVSEWATQFVQLPFSKMSFDPFKHSELNHMMTVMNILLSPIEKRESFIKKWESELTSEVNQWTVIDSDGEVEDDDQQCCPLKENDLVSLLNQIPFGHLFGALLKYDSRDITHGYMSADYMLALFSFLTDFIKILLSGLKLYSTQRYRQFTKRLGRLIYHIVQYATDALSIFKLQNACEGEMLRVQVEYDNFFLRSTKFIYSAKKHGIWQFLATIPYHMASSNTIIKLYGILQLSDNQEDSVVKVNFSNFVEKFLQLPEEEQFYLLTTFANMALARDVVEMQFIKNVLLQLFYVGFLNQSTMDHSYKNARSLLCSMCSSYPFLMSEVLRIQKSTFVSEPEHDQRLTVDLWTKLPTEVWQPEKTDLEILSAWLLEPMPCVRNELARLILQSLNYETSGGGPILPLEHHHAIALMILQSNAKFVLDNDAGVIKNVSNLVRTQSPEQSLNDWTWNVLLKLRLHLLDKSEAEMCKCFYNLPDYLQHVPDLESNIELHHLVLKKHPVASYVALMTTTLGHSVPIIFDRGFELVDVLFSAGRFEPGLACLEYMTLLFSDCSDSLYKSEKFISLLSRLIAADNSCVQFAKNLISYNFPGPVLKSVVGMIQHQLNTCRALNFNKFSNVIYLWLLSLTRLPLWTQEPGVLYLVDKILENSFFDGAASKVVTSVLENWLEAQSPSTETKSSFSSLVGWMNSKYNPPSLLPKGFNGEVAWFSYHIIQTEYEAHEKRTSVWGELLKELFSGGEKKVNVDNSLKKVCNHLRIPVRSSSVLAIYKWSYQIIATDMSHPLVPLMWQRFFSLYLCRVPGLTDRGSVGGKFFDGVINQSLFKRLKVKLEETCDHYKTLCDRTDEDKEREHFLKCFNLFQTFSLWLFDPKLHEPCLSVHMLPVQYSPDLLGLVIHGSETPWIEYLEYRDIERNLREVGRTWTKTLNRAGSRKGNRIVNRKKEKSPKDKVEERLNTYEAPLPPPSVDLRKYSFPRVSPKTMMNADEMISFVRPLLKELLEFAEQYTGDSNENLSLGCDMQELLPRLYFTRETQRVLKGHCTGFSKVVNGKSVLYSCSGPAVVKLTYQESKSNEQAKQNFAACEKAFERNLDKSVASLPEKVTAAAVLIDIAIEELKREHCVADSRADANAAKDLKGTGVHLFHELVRIWCERVSFNPPLERAFESYVEALGRDFVRGNAEENDRLLHLILSDEAFGDRVCGYFTPNASSTHDFIENYSKALDCVSAKRHRVLSKFDLARWLSERKPKFSERSRLISTVGAGLKSVQRSGEEQNTLKLLNKHLETLLMHDFPEHYGEVLNFLIEASESQSICASSWYMFLNALARGNSTVHEGRPEQWFFEPGQSMKILKYNFSKFATEQKVLSFDVIKGTMILLGSTFRSERLKAGTYGLYRKYRLYVEPIFVFFGMLSYSCVAKALEIDTGSLSDKIAQVLWPLLSDLHAPWLVPYWVDNQKGSPGFHDQNLDRCLLLPWSLSDACHASFGVSVFVDSVRFVYDALPGLNHVLSYAWIFYVTNFAHISVKDYIQNVIHESFLSLPWETFCPSLQDVELMLKVVDQFLPSSHCFLGNIFINIKWTELVQYYSGLYDAETTTKLHICLLHLLVKLPLQPSLKQNEKVAALLEEANGYAWHLVDSGCYETILSWFIMSCDPRIILENRKLDSSILRLLQFCAGYVPSVKLFHSTTLTKRLLYVRACVTCLTISNRRFKSKDSPLFKVALCNLWSDMDTVINETVPPHQRVEEAAVLLTEFLVIFTEPDLCPLVASALSEWLSIRRSQAIVLGLLRASGTVLDNPKIFGSVAERSLESYFEFTENCDWSEAIKSLAPFSKLKSEARLEKILIDNNYFLTLHAVLMKKFSKEDLSSRIVLTDLLQLLSEVKPSCDLEAKLIVIIVFALNLAEKEIKRDAKEGISYLVKFSDMLNNFANDEGNGFLSAIGLKKSPYSNKFRLICLVTCSGIMTFVKNSHPEYKEVVEEKVLQALEMADSNKIYQNIHQYASYAKTSIKDVSSVQQVIALLKHIGVKLFNKFYLN